MSRTTLNAAALLCHRRRRHECLASDASLPLQYSPRLPAPAREVLCRGRCRRPRPQSANAHHRWQEMTGAEQRLTPREAHLSSVQLGGGLARHRCIDRCRPTAFVARTSGGGAAPTTEAPNPSTLASVLSGMLIARTVLNFVHQRPTKAKGPPSLSGRVGNNVMTIYLPPRRRARQRG